jgi:hypothetical protein
MHYYIKRRFHREKTSNVNIFFHIILEEAIIRAPEK